jgi:hypothetical protein
VKVLSSEIEFWEENVLLYKQIHTRLQVVIIVVINSLFIGRPTVGMLNKIHPAFFFVEIFLK